MSIFQLAGIKDAQAKIVGSTNPLNVVRATFKGLTSQVNDQQLDFFAPSLNNNVTCDNFFVCMHRFTVITILLILQQLYQSASDETGHFLIESRRECFYRPLVMALPKSQDSPELKQCLQKKQMLWQGHNLHK